MALTARSTAIVVLLSLVAGPAVGSACGIVCNLGIHHAAAPEPTHKTHGQHCQNAPDKAQVPMALSVDERHGCSHELVGVVALVVPVERLIGASTTAFDPVVGTGAVAAGAAPASRTILTLASLSPPASLAAVRVTVLRL